MNGRTPPIYLQRQGYRMRRIVDACRLLPCLGAVLWLIPLLWPQGESAGFSTSWAIVYLFGIWIGLIGLGAVLSSRLPRSEADAEEDR